MWLGTTKVPKGFSTNHSGGVHLFSKDKEYGDKKNDCWDVLFERNGLFEVPRNIVDCFI
jgi:hypothetical protein